MLEGLWLTRRRGAEAGVRAAHGWLLVLRYGFLPAIGRSLCLGARRREGDDDAGRADLHDRTVT